MLIPQRNATNGTKKRKKSASPQWINEDRCELLFHGHIMHFHPGEAIRKTDGRGKQVSKEREKKKTKM